MSSITTLYNKYGKTKTAELLGVHHNTLYKWFIFEDGREGGRDPNQAAIRLADVLVYLKLEMDWSDEDIELMCANIDKGILNSHDAEITSK